MVNSDVEHIDRELLQLVQDDFHVVDRPWLEIGRKLNISEDEVVARLRRLHENKALQKIGPVVDGTKAGLTTTSLVAMKVPEDKVDSVASIVNEYTCVSHNYERESEYNMWFTLAAANAEELSALFEEIVYKTGIERSNILNLPTLRRFKVNVVFSFVGNNSHW